MIFDFIEYDALLAYYIAVKCSVRS